MFNFLFQFLCLGGANYKVNILVIARIKLGLMVENKKIAVSKGYHYKIFMFYTKKHKLQKLVSHSKTGFQVERSALGRCSKCKMLQKLTRCGRILPAKLLVEGDKNKLTTIKILGDQLEKFAGIPVEEIQKKFFSLLHHP